MENITRDPDFPDDPNVWMWPFDDDDASRDATKKARQIFFFFFIYLIPRFFVDSAFLLSQRRPQYLLLYPTPTSRWRRRQFRHRPSLCCQESLRRSHARRPLIQRRSTPRTRVTTRRCLVKMKTKQICYWAASSRCVLLVPIVIETRSNRGMSQPIVLICMRTYAA